MSVHVSQHSDHVERVSGDQRNRNDGHNDEHCFYDCFHIFIPLATRKGFPYGQLRRAPRGRDGSRGAQSS